MRKEIIGRGLRVKNSSELLTPVSKKSKFESALEQLRKMEAREDDALPLSPAKTLDRSNIQN